MILMGSAVFFLFFFMGAEELVKSLKGEHDRSINPIILNIEVVASLFCSMDFVYIFMTLNGQHMCLLSFAILLDRMLVGIVLLLFLGFRVKSCPFLFCAFFCLLRLFLLMKSPFTKQNK